MSAAICMPRDRREPAMPVRPSGSVHPSARPCRIWRVGVRSSPGRPPAFGFPALRPPALSRAALKRSRPRLSALHDPLRPVASSPAFRFPTLPACPFPALSTRLPGPAGENHRPRWYRATRQRKPRTGMPHRPSGFRAPARRAIAAAALSHTPPSQLQSCMRHAVLTAHPSYAIGLSYSAVLHVCRHPPLLAPARPAWMPQIHAPPTEPASARPPRPRR